MKKLVKFGALGIVAIIAIVVITNSGGSKKASTTVSNSAAATTTTSLSPLKQWLGDHAQIFTKLGTDDANLVTQIKADTASGNYATVSQACTQLGVDAKADEALPPIPNAKFALQISQLLTNVSQASSLCVSGIANSDVNEINQVAQLLNTTNTEATTLASEIAKIS